MPSPSRSALHGAGVTFGRRMRSADPRPAGNSVIRGAPAAGTTARGHLLRRFGIVPTDPGRRPCSDRRSRLQTRQVHHRLDLPRAHRRRGYLFGNLLIGHVRRLTASPTSGSTLLFVLNGPTGMMKSISTQIPSPPGHDHEDSGSDPRRNGESRGTPGTRRAERRNGISGRRSRPSAPSMGLPLGYIATPGTAATGAGGGRGQHR